MENHVNGLSSIASAGGQQCQVFISVQRRHVTCPHQVLCLVESHVVNSRDYRHVKTTLREKVMFGTYSPQHYSSR